MTEGPRIQPDPAFALLDLYDAALPHVYGHLLSRSGSRALAEELTSETFLAAVTATRKDPRAQLTTAWLIGTARHKLADHWRRQQREERGLRLAHAGQRDHEDPWEAQLDAARARDVLAGLGSHHRAALTLRYLDGLPVGEVAECMGRTLHATEALLVRARTAFRRAYCGGTDDREGRDE